MFIIALSQNMQRQVSLASSLVTVIETNLFNAQQHSNTTKSIIDISNGVLDVTSDTVTVLQSLLLSLERQVEDYSTNLDRVSPVNYPSACLPGPTEVLSCLEGEIHSNSLEENSSRIVSESFATLLNANEFLASLADLPTIDFDDINRTATEAIVIGNNALTDLAQSDLNELISSVDQTRLDIDTLSVGVSSLLTDVRQTLLETEIQFNRSVNFENELAVIEDDFSVIKSGIVVVDNTRNYSIEAVDISNTMRMVHDTLDLVNTTIGNIEQDVSVVNETVMETVSVIEETEMILDYSEEQGTMRRERRERGEGEGESKGRRRGERGGRERERAREGGEEREGGGRGREQGKEERRERGEGEGESKGRRRGERGGREKERAREGGEEGERGEGEGESKGRRRGERGRRREQGKRTRERQRGKRSEGERKRYLQVRRQKYSEKR